jgi:hypothetical protein
MSSESRPDLSIRKKLLFATVVFAGFLLLLWCVSLWWRGDRLYRQVMGSSRGWSSRIHVTDPKLGFVPKANVDAEEVFPIGRPVPTRIDGNHFRIPASDDHQFVADRPLVLALGCSLTFGAACRAEQTYPFLVAEGLEGSCINAAACSYGLVQMLLRGRHLIPKHQPDIVLVQYSPWLVDRATSNYAPTYFGKLPVPYFYEREDGSLEIHPPVFAQSRADPLSYRTSPRSATLYCSFLFRAGLPLLVHDDFWTALTRAKQTVGLTPKPTTNRQAVVDYVYSQLSRECRSAGSRMFVVMLDKGIPPIRRDSLRSIPDVLIIDAHAALAARLPARNNPSFLRRYAHWRGDPPVMVDDHPNPTAHRLVADLILGVIEQLP